MKSGRKRRNELSISKVAEGGVVMSMKTMRPTILKCAMVSIFFLGLSVQPVQAQNCTNPAATPHVCAFDSVKHAQAGTKLKGVLLMDWRNGGHDRGPTQRSMMRLAQKYGFRLDRSESQTYIKDSTLKGIDIVVFNNSDQDPIPGATQLNAIRDFVERQGKGVLAIHAAGAYIKCPNEDLANDSCRWMMRALRTQFWLMNSDNSKATLFADSVRAGEIPPRATSLSAVPSARNHGRVNSETRMIFEELPTNAGTGLNANRPYVWEGLGDEWYNYQNNPRLEGERVIQGVKYGPINILLSLDESSVASNAGCNGGTNSCKNQGTFGDRPVSWTRKVGNGLFAYQNAGHSDVYVRARTVGGMTVHDSLIEKYNWRLMKYLARDFVGCMDSAGPMYNPQASVERLTDSDPENPCLVPPVNAKKLKRIQSARSLTIGSVSHGLQIQLQASSGLRIMIHDAAGIVQWAGTAKGNEKLNIQPLKPGNYFVHALGRSIRETHRVAVR
jgi:Trehalose utilisation